ncbi:Transcriptional regulatory protein ZraR [Novipirellula aureliae]|uniref:DNA-binding transcriptional regulator NtrC n=1 Tax=Novipirellula aureliae TaxID=2527966 RepID=A0A5C6E3N0_9BACT|nr:sigma 54-interacting transcriptional regulator [Novipirellula aureliae]TWU43502.1 Transcriptional regulatory protein ZraR [Novipirellula aureliae]
MATILVVDDEPADLGLISSALEKLDHRIVTAMTAKEAVLAVRKHHPDVAILDVMLPDGNGLEVMRKFHVMDDRLPVVFVTSSSESGTAIQAMKHGAIDYLVKPIDVVELRKVVARTLEIRRLADRPIDMNAETQSLDTQAIIGRCPAMQEVYKAIGIVADQDVTVLIRGESGTGKELVARALYQYSDRVKGPFLAVNCAAIPEALLESELFGHEKGSFTGADRKRIGKFEQATGGTLFLDEIGDMSAVLQSKLLRVLQEKKFERVGGNETINADVRVIAATHRNLEKMVADGGFRADLYYRLNGFSIHLPALKDRESDLESLVEHFRRVACNDLGKKVREVASDAMEVLREYSWPGNVRELQNVIRQAILRTNGPVLLRDFLPDFTPLSDITKQTHHDLEQLISKRFDEHSHHLYDEVIAFVEQQLVKVVMERVGGDRNEAMRRLGTNPATLRSKAALELLDLDPTRDDAGESPFVRSRMTLEELEKEAITRTLEETEGCRKEAAKRLGISVRTMQRRVKELGLT